jgi:hypothetical protein
VNQKTKKKQIVEASCLPLPRRDPLHREESGKLTSLKLDKIHIDLLQPRVEESHDQCQPQKSRNRA